MSSAVLHAPQHRNATRPGSRGKMDEYRLSPKPSVAAQALPDVRKGKDLQGVSGVRYICRCICALLPNLTTSGRATVIASRTSFSATAVEDMFAGHAKSVKDLKVLEIAILLRSQGIDPTEIEGGDILRKLFGGAVMTSPHQFRPCAGVPEGCVSGRPSLLPGLIAQANYPTGASGAGGAFSDGMTPTNFTENPAQYKAWLELVMSPLPQAEGHSK